jgi:16S rRNA C967 or C1407 C5-methylase (RsmB/RsmF family)
MLKPGGLLVYSTCSFSKKQNEDIVLRFLESHKHIHHESDVGDNNQWDNDDSTLVELCRIPPVVPDIPFPCVPASVKIGNTPNDSYLSRLVCERTLRFSPQFSNTSGLFIALFAKHSPSH